jgi:hypothetical protein
MRSIIDNPHDIPESSLPHPDQSLDVVGASMRRRPARLHLDRYRFRDDDSTKGMAGEDDRAILRGNCPFVTATSSTREMVGFWSTVTLQPFPFGSR